MNKFITFEGGEGAGKTTVISALKTYLEKKYDIICTREPGGIDIAEKIRSIILDTSNTKMDGRTEALLYAAARRQHLVEKVIPSLQSNKVVLCDRFLDSSLAYQGIAREIGLEDIYKINEFAIENCMPSLTIYFDIDPKIGLERINKNKNREINRLDKEKIAFHYKVRDGYKLLAKKYPKRIVTVNAECSIEEVIDKTITVVSNHLKRT